MKFKTFFSILILILVFSYLFIGVVYFTKKITDSIMGRSYINANQILAEILWFIVSLLLLTFICVLVVLIISVKE
ncbi:MAG: hypothetical protein DRO23_09070 [Thermoprotei archaeon]|nr:MAG: hypothetical protein DRO23_09070 [Thermoprotei archaeon]